MHAQQDNQKKALACKPHLWPTHPQQLLQIFAGSVSVATEADQLQPGFPGSPGPAVSPSHCSTSPAPAAEDETQTRTYNPGRPFQARMYTMNTTSCKLQLGYRQQTAALAAQTFVVSCILPAVCQCCTLGSCRSMPMWSANCSWVLQSRHEQSGDVYTLQQGVFARRTCCCKKAIAACAK